MSTGTGSSLRPGTLLGSRYRLVRPDRDADLDAPARYAVWAARDQTLDRDVVVRALGPDTPRGRRDAFRAAAATAAGVPDSRFARVLDAGTDGDVSWVVSVATPGRTLAQLWQDAAQWRVAAALVADAAEAVAAAHAHAIEHGALRPAVIVRVEGGATRVDGLAVDAAVLDRPVDDTRRLAELLARVAAQAAPRGRAEASAVRTLTRLAADAHDGRADAAAIGSGVRRALHALPASEERPRRRAGLWVRRLVPPAVVLALVVAAWTLGRDIGRGPAGAPVGHPPAVASPSTSGAVR